MSAVVPSFAKIDPVTLEAGVFHDTSGNRAYGIMPLENVDPTKWHDYEIQRRKVSKS